MTNTTHFVAVFGFAVLAHATSAFPQSVSHWSYKPVGSLLPPFDSSASGQTRAPADGLRIVVIKGEDAVNIIQQKTAVAPVVEVRDRNNLPVPGATVTFAIQGGSGAAFSGGASTLTLTTNAAGQAAATGFSPLASGAVQINVQAVFQGQSVAATIVQTNVMTAAEAAAAGGASGTSGGSGTSAAGTAGGTSAGLSTTAIAGIAGGAAAGALTLVAMAGGGNDAASTTGSGGGGQGGAPPPAANTAPALSALTASPTQALAASGTEIAFSVQASDRENDQLTYTWDFGDGSTSTQPAPRHAYVNAGTFTVRVTVSDGRLSASDQTSVVIRSLTGSWRSSSIDSGTISATFSLTQSATSISGTAIVVDMLTGTYNATVTGTVNSSSPRVTLRLNVLNVPFFGTLRYDLLLDPSADLNSLSGIVRDPQFPETEQVVLTRQGG